MAGLSDSGLLNKRTNDKGFFETFVFITHTCVCIVNSECGVCADVVMARRAGFGQFIRDVHCGLELGFSGGGEGFLGWWGVAVVVRRGARGSFLLQR
jgi:hypothetical protein